MAGTRAIVQQGLAQGVPVESIAKLLQEDSGGLFDRNRARRIARTETTRLTNAAALASMEEATDLGITVYKMWATAGDDLVRDEHAALDGTVVLSDEIFAGPDGSEIGQQPATSGNGSFDVNCRCTLVPFIDRESAEASSSRRQESQ